MPTSQWQSTNLNVKKRGGKGMAREQNKKKLKQNVERSQNLIDLSKAVTGGK